MKRTKNGVKRHVFMNMTRRKFGRILFFSTFRPKDLKSLLDWFHWETVQQEILKILIRRSNVPGWPSQLDLFRLSPSWTWVDRTESKKQPIPESPTRMPADVAFHTSLAHEHLGFMRAYFAQKRSRCMSCRSRNYFLKCLKDSIQSAAKMSVFDQSN